MTKTGTSNKQLVGCAQVIKW